MGEYLKDCTCKKSLVDYLKNVYDETVDKLERIVINPSNK